MATNQTPTDRRIQLHGLLETVLGSSRVYYRPPESTKLKYPCIVYNLRTGDTLFANNMPYKFERCYDVTLIRKEADSDLTDKLAMSFPKCRFDRSFTSDNLIHDNFVLYY